MRKPNRAMFPSSLLAVALLCSAAAVPARGSSESRSLVVGGVTRTYRLHVPPGLTAGQKAALVLVFHGGGGQGRGIERMTGFSDLADRESFLVAYPDGYSRNWNDGRGATALRAQKEGIDDVAFVEALIEDVTSRWPVDTARVFATGISNGAIFCHYLAAHLSGRIAAIAPVAGGIAEPIAGVFSPSDPVSVFILQGTADPLVPYAGGDVAWGRGRIIPTSAAAALWVRVDGCLQAPASERLPDADPGDGCTVTSTRWSGGRRGTEVLLYDIHGGGHTWPSGLPYLPERWVGKVCRDVDATEAIWAFFQSHSKRPAPAGSVPSLPFTRDRLPQ